MASHASSSRPASLWNKRKTVVLGAAGVALAAYLAYRASQPAGQERQQSSASASTSSPAPAGLVARLRTTLSNYAQAVAASSSACATLASDLHAFLTSDVDEVPRSLRQLAKLVQSEEVQSSLRTCTNTVVQGATSALPSTSGGPSALDSILEAVLSERGRSLVGLAVGVATKNATSTLCEFMQRMQEQQQQQRSTASSLDMAVQVLSSENGEKLLSLLITRSIRTTISAYVDATSGYNMYDDMVHSITKQEHRDAVTEVMTRVTAAFCREVATAYRKATQQPANQRPAAAHEHTNGYCTPPAWEDGSRPGSIDGVEAAGLSTALSAELPPMAPGRMFVHQPNGKVRSAGSLTARQNAPRPAAPAWVKQVADLAKEKDVRALVVDVTSSATREATRGVVETLVTTCKLDVMGARFASAEALPIYALLTILVALMMFALSPPAALVV